MKLQRYSHSLYPVVDMSAGVAKCPIDMSIFCQRYGKERSAHWLATQWERVGLLFKKAIG